MKKGIYFLKRCIKFIMPYGVLKLIKRFRSTNKIVCYTCVTGGYDFLLPILKRDKKVDYICFTDNMNINPRGWDLRNIPSELSALSPRLQNRAIKIKPHVYLKKYKYSVYVDGNILVNCEVSKFVKKYNFRKHFIYINRHPYRDCVYDEGIEVVKFGMLNKTDVNKQLDGYKKEGFPTHFGLTENNILLRKHNNSKCKKLMDLWCNEVMTKTYRDQLSLMYCFWKLNYSYGLLNVSHRIGSLDEPFILSIFHKKNTFTLCNSMDANNIIIIKEINFS